METQAPTQNHPNHPIDCQGQIARRGYQALLAVDSTQEDVRSLRAPRNEAWKAFERKPLNERSGNYGQYLIEHVVEERRLLVSNLRHTFPQFN